MAQAESPFVYLHRVPTRCYPEGARDIATHHLTEVIQYRPRRRM